MTVKVFDTLAFQDQGGRITGLPDPTDPQEAATKAYVDSGLKGLSWKSAAVAATTTNISIGSAPASIDDVTLVAGDRILVKEQTTLSQNGIYQFNGVGVSLTRTTDADTTEGLEQACIIVEEGTTYAGTTWRQASINFSLGSGAIDWEPFGMASNPATTSDAGVIELATQAEVDEGLDAQRAVTPATLATLLGGLALFNTILSGSGAPSNGLGNDGDYYLRTDNTSLYGPKATTWPSPVSLIGAAGSNGANGQGLTWRGTYAGGTSYVPYDLVVYNSESYICILATTGNAPSNATYWTKIAAKGADGSNGATGATGQGLTWRGTYSGALAYVPYDVVFYNGSVYICILAGTGNLPTNTTYFSVMAEKGNTGDTGAAGTNGQGVPTGGTTGQVLKKNSNSNYDTVWQDESGGAGGALKYAANVGGSTSVNVNHALDTTDVVVQCRYVSTGAVVVADITVVDADNVSIIFATAPASNSIRVVVVG